MSQPQNPSADRVKNLLTEVSRGLEVAPRLSHLGDPALRKVTEEVSVEEGVNIAQKLIPVLDAYRSFSHVGAGLAAPQIGISKSVFVTSGKNGFEIYLNPKIINTSPEQNYYRESCLSSRMFWSDIKRPETIDMSWTDEKGIAHQEKFSGFKARLIQHEYDHLQGICCLDRSIVGTIEYSGIVKDEKLRSQTS